MGKLSYLWGGKSYQNDPNAIQLHEVLIDTAGVCLKEAGYQPDHI